MNDEKTLGEKIREERKRKKWTQAGLGMKLHVDGSTVGRWERDERRPDNVALNEMAKLFGIKVTELDPQVKELMVSDVSKGRYICQFEPDEKGWQIAKRAWNNSVAFRCLVVAVITAELLIMWSALSSNVVAQNLSIVAVGAALLIGDALWPSTKKVDKLLAKVCGVLAVVALVLVVGDVQW